MSRKHRSLTDATFIINRLFCSMPYGGSAGFQHGEPGVETSFDIIERVIHNLEKLKDTLIYHQESCSRMEEEYKRVKGILRGAKEFIEYMKGA